jgi:preprotein translocase subunit Sec63
MPKKRNENAPFWLQIHEAERHIITFALEQCQTILRASSILGVSPNFLSDRINKLGIIAPTSRSNSIALERRKEKADKKASKEATKAIVTPTPKTPISTVEEIMDEDELEDDGAFEDDDDDDDDDDDASDDDDDDEGDDDDDDEPDDEVNGDTEEDDGENDETSSKVD